MKTSIDKTTEIVKKHIKILKEKLYQPSSINWKTNKKILKEIQEYDPKKLISDITQYISFGENIIMLKTLKPLNPIMKEITVMKMWMNNWHNKHKELHDVLFLEIKEFQDATIF